MKKNSLSNLFDAEDQEEMAFSKKVLIFDGHNLAYRNVFGAVNKMPEDNDKFLYWKHLMVSSLFAAIKKYEPDRVVLAFDTKGSWRYKVYPQYKANRKDLKNKAVVNFEKFYKALETFKHEIMDVFPNIYVVDVEASESDDIIAVLVQDVFKANTEVIVISSDKDFNQLLTYPNVKQYDPIRGAMVKCLNPKKELMIKIISGDKSDNILPIKTRVGKATAEKILKQGLDSFLKSDEQINENFKRNSILIDFSYIPMEIRKAIINNYTQQKPGEIDGTKLMNFFTRNRLVKHMDDWAKYQKYVKRLS